MDVVYNEPVCQNVLANFGLTSQSGPPPEVVPNILVGPNRKAPLCLIIFGIFGMMESSPGQWMFVLMNSTMVRDTLQVWELVIE